MRMAPTNVDMIIRVLLCFICINICTIISTRAQSSINPGGNTIVSTNITIDWSLGQVTIVTIDDPNFKLTQGQQQPQNINGQVEAVPTLGEWGLINLGLLLMIFASVAVMSRYKTNSRTVMDSHIV